MAEFTEVMKQMERMCNSFRCFDCPLSQNEVWKKNSCVSHTRQCPQEAEEIIMKWAEEHPIKTNADKFKEVFGVELDVEEIAEATNGCILKCGEIKYCEECVKYNFWNKEYKEPSEV